MTTTPEPSEYQVRLEALKLACLDDDTTHEVIKRAKEFATYLRDGVDIDRKNKLAEQNKPPIVTCVCDDCMSFMHPHAFGPCPENGCQCKGANPK